MLLNRLISYFRPAPSFRELINSYRASRAFRDLAESTRGVYSRVLDHLLSEIGPDVPLPQLNRATIERHLAPLSRGACRERMKKLRLVCRHGLAIGLLSCDPMAGLRLPRGSEPRHTWTEDEIAQFREYWPLGTRPRLCFELALGTAQRRADLWAMRWEDIHDGMIHVVQAKTGRRLRIPLCSDLRAALDRETIRSGSILRTAEGAGFRSPQSLGAWFRKQCDEAALPHCALHGLRRALCRRLAESGASSREIGAISGHVTLSETDRYCRDVDQAALAQRALGRLAK